jgi:hypothetical protein
MSASPPPLITQAVGQTVSLTDMRIDLTEDEALVLFEYLSTRGDGDALPVSHASERVALWNLVAALEKTLVPILDPNYKSLLLQAQERLVVSGGNPE